MAFTEEKERNITIYNTKKLSIASNSEFSQSGFRTKKHMEGVSSVRAGRVECCNLLASWIFSNRDRWLWWKRNKTLEDYNNLTLIIYT